MASIDEQRLREAFRAVESVQADDEAATRVRLSVAQRDFLSQSRRWRRRTTASIGVFLVVATLTGGIFLAARLHRAPGATSAASSPATVTPSTSRRPPVTSSSAPGAAPVAPDVGFNGLTGWRITTSAQLQLTSDGGQRWVTAALPASISLGDVKAVSTDPGGPALVAAVNGHDVEVLVQRDASWVVHAIHFSLPTNLPPLGPPDRILFGRAGPDFVDMILGWDLTTSTEIVQNEVSNDGGSSFTLIRSQTELPWVQVAFKSPSDGVVVAGPALTFLYHTNDGGAQWSSSSLPPGLSHPELGNPMDVSGGLAVTAMSSEPDGSETVTLLRSVDGAAFSIMGTPLAIPASESPGGVTAASFGSSIWIFANNHVLFRTTDSGDTWTKVSNSSVPQGVGSASFATGTSGEAVTEEGSCAEFKSDCTTSLETFVTEDGGTTWVQEP
jgi:photosystem II stability/assembly factor-like uncharacterized protein